MIEMRKIRDLTVSGVLAAATVALPAIGADVGSLPIIGAGSQLGTQTYDGALPGPGFTFEVHGQRTTDDKALPAQTGDEEWPRDPADVRELETRTAVLGIGLTRAFALSLGVRQVKETMSLPELRDLEGKILAPAVEVTGAERSNAFYSASLGLVQRPGFGLALTGFGTAYIKQDAKAIDRLSADQAREPSYSLPLKPSYGFVLQSVLRLAPRLAVYGNVGDRYHNDAPIGNTPSRTKNVLRHEPFVQTLVAWQPLPFVELMAGYDARWLQVFSDESRGGDGSTLWHGLGQAKYGAALQWAGLRLEGYARQGITGHEQWAATRDSVAVSLGYRMTLGKSRAVRRANRPRTYTRENIRLRTRVRSRRAEPFRSGRARVSPPPRSGRVQTPTTSHREVKTTPARKTLPGAVVQPAVRSQQSWDIRDAERVAREARQQEAWRQRQAEEAEQLRVQRQQQAYIDELNNRADESFPEIDNLPDVTDEEYFWNGLDDG